MLSHSIDASVSATRYSTIKNNCLEKHYFIVQLDPFNCFSFRFARLVVSRHVDPIIFIAIIIIIIPIFEIVFILVVHIFEHETNVVSGSGT